MEPADAGAEDAIPVEIAGLQRAAASLDRL
jgi:hypothetical protein